MKLIAALIAVAILPGCVTIGFTPRADATYYQQLVVDCANKDVQEAYLTRQLTRPGFGTKTDNRNQETEIKNKIWELRASCQ